jgi:Ni/Fe-hydrogenase subunit HybB-like protein
MITISISGMLLLLALTVIAVGFLATEGYDDFPWAIIIASALLILAVGVKIGSL